MMTMRKDHGMLRVAPYVLTAAFFLGDAATTLIARRTFGISAHEIGDIAGALHLSPLAGVAEEGAVVVLYLAALGFAARSGYPRLAWWLALFSSLLLATATCGNGLQIILAMVH